MKTYSSSELNSNRAEILDEAEYNGVIIQERKTNKEVRREFVMQGADRDDDGNLSFGSGGLIMNEDIILEVGDTVHVNDTDTTYEVAGDE